MTAQSAIAVRRKARPMPVKASGIPPLPTMIHHKTGLASTVPNGKDNKRTSAQTELGQRVRERRGELRLSQMALADKIGLHFTFVSSVERGERNLSLQSLVRLADGLRVDPGSLVEGLRPGPEQ